tara:strand:- start:183 stop:563 length:381 start_codon:yes stop_codon:yes gene_type:complete
MFNLSSKYLKIVGLLVTVYVVSQVFHRIQRQRYIAVAKNTLTILSIEQEVYFSTHFGYTTELKDLDMGDLGPLSISLFATSEGWSGVATHKHLSSKDGCTIYFGKAEIFSLGDTTPKFPGDVACTP